MKSMLEMLVEMLDELLRRLHACQFVYEHGDNVCPAKWKLGEKTIQTTIENIGK